MKKKIYKANDTVPLILGILLLVVSLALVLSVLKPSFFYDEENAYLESLSGVELRQEIDKFMNGEPVNPKNFPWYDSLVGNDNFEILREALGEGIISNDEFIAFDVLKIAWVREYEPVLFIVSSK